MKLNQYTTAQVKTRDDAGTAASRVRRIDLPDASIQDAFRLSTKATEWVNAAAAAKGITLTADQIEAQVAAIEQLPVAYLRIPNGLNHLANT